MGMAWSFQEYGNVPWTGKTNLNPRLSDNLAALLLVCNFVMKPTLNQNSKMYLTKKPENAGSNKYYKFVNINGVFGAFGAAVNIVINLIF